MSEFDYKGFTKEYLEDICSEASCIREKSSLRNYGWGMYGLGRIIRQYAYYPQAWPLLCYTNHGVNRKLMPKALEVAVPFNLYFSHRLVKEHNEQAKKKKLTLYNPAYSMQSPFVWYRQRKRIKKSSAAQGTLIYFPHSTELVDSHFDIDDYIDKLKNLPKAMYPICISLHMWDIRKGLHEILLDEGFAVVSAGHSEDVRFYERFYNILRNFKHTTSNDVGSNVFYSVEMEIPFFLLGKEMQWFNYGDHNNELGIVTSHTQTPRYEIEHELFKLRVEQITPEQKKYVKECLGLSDEKNGLNISRLQLSFLLYKHFFIYAARKSLLETKHFLICSMKKYFPSAVDPLRKIKNIFLK